MPANLVYIYLSWWNIKNNRSVETAVSIYDNNWWDIYIWGNFFLTVWMAPLVFLLGTIVRLVSIKLLLRKLNTGYWMVPAIIVSVLAHIMFWMMSLNMLLLFLYFW